MYFPGVESFRESLNEILRSGHDIPTITLDLIQVTELDFTALKVKVQLLILAVIFKVSLSALLILLFVQMLKCVAVECNKRETVLHFVNATPKVARSIANMLPSNTFAFHPKVT